MALIAVGSNTLTQHVRHMYAFISILPYHAGNFWSTSHVDRASFKVLSWLLVALIIFNWYFFSVIHSQGKRIKISLLKFKY